MGRAGILSSPPRIEARHALAHHSSAPPFTRLAQSSPARFAAALLLYSALSCFLYSRVLVTLTGRLPICACGDEVQQAWFLHSAVFAVSHGHNPFLSNWINYPEGVNLALNTAEFALGLLSAPAQFLVGAVGAYNLFLMLALVASASAMYLVMRRWVRRWMPAVIAGLLYGFSPYMIGQGQGHLNLTAAFLPPVILLVIHDIVVLQRHSPLRDGSVLAVLVSLQYFISSEVLGMTAIIAACGVCLLAIARARDVRDHARYALAACVYCGILVSLVLVYPVWFATFGPQHVNGPPRPLTSLAMYPGDLLSPVLPTSFQHFAPLSVKLHGNSLTGGDVTENGMYLGVPFLLLIAASCYFFRRSRALLFSVTMMCISILLALGPRLTFNGTNTGVRLPFTVIRHIPFLQDMLPVRFSLFIQLFAAASLGLTLDLAYERWQHRCPTMRGRPVIVAMLLAGWALMPMVPMGPYSAAATNTSFYASRAVTRIPAGSTVLTYPYTANPNLEGMLGQLVSTMRFKLVGSYAFLPRPPLDTGTTGPSLLPPTTVQAIFFNCFQPAPTIKVASYPPVNTSTIGALRTFISRYAVSTVIVSRVGTNVRGLIRYLTQALGPGQRTHGLLVWFHVRKSLAATRASRVAGARK